MLVHEPVFLVSGAEQVGPAEIGFDITAFLGLEGQTVGGHRLARRD